MPSPQSKHLHGSAGNKILVCPKCNQPILPHEKWYGRGWCGGPDGEVVTYIWKDRKDATT